MENSQAFSLGLQVGEMLNELTLVLEDQKKVANGSILVVALNQICRAINEDPDKLSGLGLSRADEASKTFNRWVKRLVDDRDLPKDASDDTVRDLYTDLLDYFGDSLKTLRAGVPGVDAEIL